MARSRVIPRSLSLAAVRHQVSIGSRPVWITSLLLALLTWPRGIAYPGTGLDFSWMGGLYMAVHEGKHFGTEVVFTYGPLGFLAWPGLWFGWLAALSFLYFSAVYVALTVTVISSLSRSVGLLGAVVIVFLTFSAAVAYIEEAPLLLAIGLSFAAMRAERPDRAPTALVLGGGLLCAIEPLIKLSIGPPTVVIVLLGLAGARVGRRQWAAFATIAVGGFFAAWFLAGQGVGNLWDYGVNGAEMISGYNEAMGFAAAETWEAVAIIAFALGLVISIHRAEFRDRRARVLATALTAIAAYVVFKYGTTQFLKGGPPVVALSTLLVIFIVAPWPRRRAALFLAAFAVLGLVTLHSNPAPVGLDVIPKFDQFKKSAELAIRPGLRQGYINGQRASLQATLNVPPRVIAAVRGKPVAIDPLEISVAWAYELDWRPLPVFQTYSAYTAKLDRLNAAATEDPSGPQMILRQMPAGTGALGGRQEFAGRQPLWDSPEQNIATICNFVPVLTEGSWQVLKRIPDRCVPPKLVASQTAEPGEVVPLPQAGQNELVILRLEGAQVEGFERVTSLFWRPDERHVVLDDGKYSYRLVPGTSADGLIVSAGRRVNLIELPVASDISVDGADGPLHFDFYRIRLKPKTLVPERQPG